MNLTVKKKDMSKTLAKARSVAARKTVDPVSSSLLLEAGDGSLRVAATDLETYISCKIPAHVDDAGCVAVPAHKTHEIVKMLPGEEILIRKSDDRLDIRAGRARFSLATMPGEDFPEPPETGNVREVVLDGKALAEMIGKVFHAVILDEYRFNLSGVLVEKKDLPGGHRLRLVATDGHRLSMIERDVPGLERIDIENGIVIIPRKGVAELKRMAEKADDITLGLSNSLVVARNDGTVLVQRTIKGRFPDYEAIIPKDTKTDATVNRRAFAEALRRMAIMTSEGGCVTLDFKEGILEMTSHGPEVGLARETMEAGRRGEPFSVGFNPRYLIDLCHVMCSEELTLGFVNDQSPCLFKGEDDPGFLAVVMPMVGA